MCVLRVRVCVCTGLSVSHASARLLRVEKDRFNTSKYIVVAHDLKKKHHFIFMYRLYLNDVYISVL